MLKPLKLNDEQLVAAIKNGDRNALIQLYKDNYMAVRSYILKNNGKEEDIEDVLQDASIAIWEKIQADSLILNAKLSTLVFAICKNQWLKRLNKNSRMSNMPDGIAENLTEKTDSIDLQDAKIIGKLMNDLGEKCQKILTMFYFENRDMNDIAETLDYSNADTAKAKKHQCFKQLQTIFLNRYSKSDFLGN